MNNYSRKFYINWLTEKYVSCNLFLVENYSKLIDALSNIEYYCTIPEDINRNKDGLDLRDDFLDIYEEDINDELYYELTDENNNRCSVLEMMCALANRCETDIMSDMYHNNCGRWFYYMLQNLGLLEYDNDNFSPNEIKSRVYNFMNRTYSKNGSGGLFIIRRTNGVDISRVPLWEQMNWYCQEYLEYHN